MVEQDGNGSNNLKTTEEKIKALKEERKTFISGVFETSPNNMEFFRYVYDNHGDTFCPDEETTFEEFVGYMATAGLNFLAMKFKECVINDMIEECRKNNIPDPVIDMAVKIAQNDSGFCAGINISALLKKGDD